MKASKRGLLVISIFAVSMVAYYLFDQHRTTKQVEQLTKEFPKVALGTPLNNRVNSIVRNPNGFRDVTNYVLIVFTDGTKATIESEYDLKTNRQSLEEILTEGDSIVKNAGTKEFEIHRSNINHISQVWQFSIR